MQTRVMNLHLSALVTCYNERAYIAEAIESVLAQSASQSIEQIVVVDDGSTDGSGEILSLIASSEDRVTVYHIENKGLAGARNFGLSRVHTPFVALLDGDDLWHEDKVARQLDTVASSTAGVALWYTDFLDFTTDITAGVAVPVRKFDQFSLKTLEDFFVYDGPIVPSTVLLRTDAVQHAGGFDQSKPVLEDMDLWLRLAAADWKFQHVLGALTFKRRREGSLSGQKQQMAAVADELGERWAAADPALRVLLPRRRSWRAAKLAQAYFAGGEDRQGWRSLKEALVANPRNFRAYLYAVWAVAPQPLRLQLIRTFKRWRAARAASGSK